MPKQDPAEFYLDFLDKEMTIMGILSTFCVAVVALVLDKVLGVKEGEHTFLSDVWKFGQYYIATASALMLISGLVFYRQRSLIARYYGGICLRLSKPDKPEKLSSLIEEAHSGKTWFHYYTAFVIMGLAGINYAAALCASGSNPSSYWIRNHYLSASVLALTVGIIIIIFGNAVLVRHKYEDEPFKAFFSSLRRRTQLVKTEQ